jgi:hypothetical protein
MEGLCHGTVEGYEKPLTQADLLYEARYYVVREKTVLGGADSSVRRNVEPQVGR